MSIIDATTYIDGKTPVDLICNICGTKKLKVKPTTYLGDCTKSTHGSYCNGCQTCRDKYFEQQHLAEFEDALLNFYNDKYQIVEFHYDRKNVTATLKYRVTLKCNNCGHEFKITDIRSKDLHCPACESNFMGERIIGSILTLNNIDFKAQVMCYPDYLTKSLRLDFLASINGKLYDIEYNGQQHYDDSINWYSGDRDKNKEVYCKREGIIYAPVPYTKVTIRSIFDYLNKEYNFNFKVIPDEDYALPFGYSVKAVLLYLKDHSANDVTDKFHISYKLQKRFLQNLGFDTPTDWSIYMKNHKGKPDEVKDELKYYVTHDYDETLLEQEYKRGLKGTNRSRYSKTKETLTDSDKSTIIDLLKADTDSAVIYKKYHLNKNSLYTIVKQFGYKNITAVRCSKVDKFIADPANQQKVMDYLLDHDIASTIKQFEIKSHDVSDILKEHGYVGAEDLRNKKLGSTNAQKLKSDQAKAFRYLKTHSTQETSALLGVDRHIIMNWVHDAGYATVKQYRQMLDANRMIEIRKFLLPNKKSHSVAQAREKFGDTGRAEIEQAYKTLGYKTLSEFRASYDPDEDPLLRGSH